MLKKQMEYEMKVAQEGIKLKEDEMYRIREKLSQFLGSYKKGNYSFHEREEVKVLSWAEIYFELGKMKGDFDQMNEVFAMRNGQKNLFSEIEMIKQDLNVLKDKDGGFKKREEVNIPFNINR